MVAFVIIQGTFGGKALQTVSGFTNIQFPFGMFLPMVSDLVVKLKQFSTCWFRALVSQTFMM